MEFLRFILGINMDQYEKGSAAEWVCIGIAIGVMVILAAIFVVLCFTNKKGTYNIQSISFGGICLALSFGLSYLRLFRMPLGGSVTAASILPICLYAYIFGFRRGLLIGIIYSLLQLMQDPIILNLVQVLLDYVLGFTCICVVGIIPKLLKSISQKNAFFKYISKFDLAISMVAVGILRMIFSTLSGVIYFGVAWGASFAYNSVLLVDTAIAIIPAVILQISPHFMRYARNIQSQNKIKQSQTVENS